MNSANFLFACMSMLAHGGYVARTLPSSNVWVSIAPIKFEFDHKVGYLIKNPLNPIKPPFSYGFPMVFLWQMMVFVPPVVVP